MNDFRKDLYSRYSSTFKEHISEFDIKSVATTLRKYRYQYLPILSEFKKDVRILELGCGRGLFLEFLIDSGYENVFGIDVSREQINIAKVQKLNVEEIGVLEYLKSNNEKFDLIFAIDLIEHFHKDELIILFEGIYKNLKNGGAFVFHTPNGLGINANKIIYGDLTHLSIFTPNSAIQILKLVGFNDIKFFETEPYAKDVNGVIRLLLWKIVRIFINVLRLIETGGTEKILTQNFIGVAKKG
jgi:2-polyprenyl-3-methyl-5-hydroxy-6-metoxy-1,4-benzoquinol methylase